MLLGTTVLGIVSAAAPAIAQEAQTRKADETVTVIGVAGVADQSSGSVATIDTDEILREDAQGLGDILALVPAATVQTNSRGESLVFLRGAGERQTAIYFDGAALNIPWDNRLNLTAIPANIITGARIYSGPVPVRFGANTSGGVVDLLSVGTAMGSAMRLEGGGEGHFFGEGHVAQAAGFGDVILAGGYRRHDGVSVAADLPFSQDPDDLRTNTDMRQANVFARWARSIGRFDLAATGFYVTGERGVAPESDRDPGEARVRYWRYPEMDYGMGILSMDYRTALGGELSATLAGQWFGQTIDSYASAAYEVIGDRQVDGDQSWSFRAIYRHDVGPVHLGWSVNALKAEHRQREIDLGAGDDSGAELFRGRTLSAGLDAETEIAPGVLITGGAGFDWVDAPETGGRPALNAFWEPHLTAGVSWEFAPDWTMRAGAGRQSRIPTLRELYGTAINRFLENPDLKPERITLVEAALAWAPAWGGIGITPFARLSRDLIDQRVVEVNGQSLRQRINLAASRIAGVEVTGAARLDEHWSLSGHVTWQHARSRADDAGLFDIPLSERPDVLGRMTVTYEHPSGVTALAEAAYRGRAWSPDADGDLVRLPASTKLDLRIAHNLRTLFAQLPDSELYVRADNLLDTEIVPQVGLPDPGRSLRGGLRVAF